MAKKGLMMVRIKNRVVLSVQGGLSNCPTLSGGGKRQKKSHKKPQYWAGEAPKVPAKSHVLAAFCWFLPPFRPLDLHGRGFKCPGGPGLLPNTTWGWKSAKVSGQAI